MIKNERSCSLLFELPYKFDVVFWYICLYLFLYRKIPCHLYCSFAYYGVIWFCPVILDLYFYSEKTSRSCLFPLVPSGELALTNFDTQRLEEITNTGIRISSNQVKLPSGCFSLLHQTFDFSLLLQCICCINCVFNVTLCRFSTLWLTSDLQWRWSSSVWPTTFSSSLTALWVRYRFCKQ